MHASNPETIYVAGSGDWTQARLITASASARTVPMSHMQRQDKLQTSFVANKMANENDDDDDDDDDDGK